MSATHKKNRRKKLKCIKTNFVFENDRLFTYYASSFRNAYYVQPATLKIADKISFSFGCFGSFRISNDILYLITYANCIKNVS